VCAPDRVGKTLGREPSPWNNVVVGGGISYLSLGRRRPARGGGGGGGGVSVGEAVFNWSVVVLAAFTAFLFLIS
jgi:hypothetical protein